MKQQYTAEQYTFYEKKNANRTLHDILHKLYHGLLSLLNIIQFRSACTNVTSFTPTHKVQPSQREICRNSPALYADFLQQISLERHNKHGK